MADYHHAAVAAAAAKQYRPPTAISSQASMIPIATPYPWTDERTAPRRDLVRGGAGRSGGGGVRGVQKSSGFAYLQQKLISDESAMSVQAENILRDALEEQNVDLEQYDYNSGGDDDFDDAAYAESLEPRFKRSRATNNAKLRETNVIDKSMSDETVLQAAQAGRISFLGSILRTVQDNSSGGGAVTTRHCIRTCSLAVPPASVPPNMDAKEMVLAALHFLSSECPSEDTDALPSLPLIRSVQQTGDLEKRSYVIAQAAGSGGSNNNNCSWNSIQVEALEDIFLNSVNSYKWTARERFCPRFKTGQDLLLLKGNPPQFAVPGKKQKSGGSGSGSGAHSHHHHAVHHHHHRRTKKGVEKSNSNINDNISDDLVAVEATRIVNETKGHSAAPLDDLY